MCGVRAVGVEGPLRVAHVCVCTHPSPARCVAGVVTGAVSCGCPVAQRILESESEAARRAREATAQCDEMLARMSLVEEQLRSSTAKGDMAAATAADTIVQQEQLFEDLVRYVRYKDAVVRWAVQPAV